LTRLAHHWYRVLVFTIEEFVATWGISHPLIVFIVSMLPISELRGAIPIGINVLDMHWYHAFPIAYVGNLVPVPFLFFFMERIRRLSARMGILGVWVEKFLNRTRRRAEFIEKYGRVGLALFVAIPLPITGAWTGIIAAYLLGMRFRDTILPVCVGVLISGTIVTLLSLYVPELLDRLGWGPVVAVTAVILIALVAWWLWPRKKSKQPDQEEQSP
jgi:uncharacterized membrane protein